jgi:uncharacterized repeat protein (TIGR02543 family)
MNTRFVCKRSKLGAAVMVAVAVGMILLTGCGKSGPVGPDKPDDKPNVKPGVKKYTLNAASNPQGLGDITLSPPGPEFDSGTAVTVKVTPPAGGQYVFSGWEGASASKDTVVTIIMNGNKTLTAKFRGAGPQK